MKRVLEPDLDTDPPCGLPAELWSQEIIPNHRYWFDLSDYFLTLRSLRLTCRWFSRHINIPAYHTAHDHFWPAVEQYAKEGYTSALRQLDWPTHPNVLLSGYSGPNYSYGRAGSELVKRGDLETLMIMARHGGEIWSLWMYKAVKHGHVDILAALYTSGLRHKSMEHLVPHQSALITAVRVNRLDMVRIMHVHTARDQIPTVLTTLAIEWHCDMRVLRCLGVDDIKLRASAVRALLRRNYAHVEYVIDHYWTQRVTRTTTTRAQRICTLLGRVLKLRYREEDTCRTWADGLGLDCT